MGKITKEELMAKFGIEDEELLEKVAGGLSSVDNCDDPRGEMNCFTSKCYPLLTTDPKEAFLCMDKCKNDFCLPR